MYLSSFENDSYNDMTLVEDFDYELLNELGIKKLHVKKLLILKIL